MTDYNSYPDENSDERESVQEDVYALLRAALRLIIANGLEEDMDTTYGSLTAILRDTREGKGII